MPKKDLSKIVFYFSTLTLVVTLIFSMGFYSAISKNFIFKAYRNSAHWVEETIQTILQEKDVILRIRPTHHLQPIRYQGNGVTINLFGENDKDMIFLSGFFDNSNELRLIKRSGETVARWPVKFYDYFDDVSHLRKPPATEWNADIHGALMLPDGSVVFNFEYNGLVKLDKCGNLVWKVELATHHSVERSLQGGFWVPNRRTNREPPPLSYPPFNPPFLEDSIVEISADGEIISETSVPAIFYQSGQQALLTATGNRMTSPLKWDKELVHLNKVAPLTADLAKNFPMFNEGDLILSLREYNMILMVDIETKLIKWVQTGPWVRQHDPEFTESGTILVFNNNTYFGSNTSEEGEQSSDIPNYSNIVEINPETRDSEIVYGGKASQSFTTTVRGKHEITKHGGLLVTEFEGGRVFEIDSNGKIVWEYINRYDDTHVAEISEARLYSDNYFSVSDWSCNN